MECQSWVGSFLNRKMVFQKGEWLLQGPTARQPQKTKTQAPANPRTAPFPLGFSAFFSFSGIQPPTSTFSQSLYSRGICKVLTFPRNVFLSQGKAWRLGTSGCVSLHVCVCVCARSSSLGIKPKLNSSTVFYQMYLLCTPRHWFI